MSRLLRVSSEWIVNPEAVVAIRELGPQNVTLALVGGQVVSTALPVALLLEALDAELVEPACPTPPSRRRRCEPPSDDQASAGDVLPADATASAGDEPPSDDQAVAGDEPPTNDQAVADNEPPSDDQAIAGDEPPTNDQAVADNEPPSDNQASAGDEPHSNDQASAGDEPSPSEGA